MSDSPAEGPVAADSTTSGRAETESDAKNSSISGPTVRRRRRLGSSAAEPAPPSAEPSSGDKPEVRTDSGSTNKRTRRVVNKSNDSDAKAATKSKRVRTASKTEGASSRSTSPDVSSPRKGRSPKAEKSGSPKAEKSGSPKAEKSGSPKASETSGPKITRTRKVAGARKAGTDDEQIRGDSEEPAANGVQGSGSSLAPASGASPAAGAPMPPARPRIGDSRPAPANQAEGQRSHSAGQRRTEGSGDAPKRRRRGGRGRGRGKGGGGEKQAAQQTNNRADSKKGSKPNRTTPVEFKTTDDRPVELDERQMERHRGKERKGRPVGRYQMVVHVHGELTHIAILEGRSLIEYYVSRPSDDVAQIHGNIYIGKVQNVLPGMEAAFVDIGTPKNAVLYRGDVTFDSDDMEDTGSSRSKAKGRNPRRNRKEGPRIEQLLKPRQSIVCQVTKNPIAHKGARLTTEVSLPGRFVVLVPNSNTFGISKRLPDKERKRLRNLLDKVKPAQHGLIVRTAAENVTADEIARDVARLTDQWDQIEKLAKSTKTPTLLFREPDLAVRVIREEFTRDYRGVVIDDRALYEQVKGYMETVTPALADRIEFYDPSAESMPVFDRYHIEEQLRKAVDRKVWLPSGGSLIIEHTEALSVIDVNTGKNVGKSSLEETVFRNNLEAAEEIAKQLRLRDIGGIIVIDFVDMEVSRHRDEVLRVFRDSLARDKTRTQAFEISDLGLVEMTRKRIGEGLLESVSNPCPHCEARGVQLDESTLS